MAAKVLAFASLCLVLAAKPARANDPIDNFENLVVPAPAGNPLSQAQVRDAIVAGAAQRQWKVNYVAAGMLVAQRNVAGRHLVEVDIRYSPKEYSVLYRNSINMNYRAGEATIHPNYNRWARELVDSIDRALSHQTK
ncbi:MAG TPA: hypothetical protein VM140_14260 [Burkholderiales bacterium]|nr:hypothetical protein [Burkholderiales bacterium]